MYFSSEMLGLDDKEVSLIISSVFGVEENFYKIDGRIKLWRR